MSKEQHQLIREAEPEPNADAPRNSTLLLAAKQSDERNKGIISKDCTPFISCISKISNTQVDDAKKSWCNNANIQFDRI